MSLFTVLQIFVASIAPTVSLAGAAFSAEVCTVDALFESTHFQDLNPISFHQILEDSIKLYRVSEVLKNDFDRLVDYKTPPRSLYPSETYAKLLHLRETQNHITEDALKSIRYEIKARIKKDNDPKIILRVLEEKKTWLKKWVSEHVDPAITELSISKIEDEIDDRIHLLKECARNLESPLPFFTKDLKEADFLQMKSFRRIFLLRHAIDRKSVV